MVRIRATQRLAEAAAATERLRLADELHDSCLQTLAAVDMRIEAVRQMTAGPAEPLVGELDALKEVVRHAGSQIRASFQMHGVILDPGPSVVRRIVEERWPSPAEVEIDPTVELSTEQWRALEMFVKEGINNALRHGGGAHLALRLTRARAGSVQCLLRNDGRLLAGTPPFGYGLNRLREQVEAVGGRLAFESDPQGGATLSVMFSRDP
jgi:signal transduction histidine kinase